MSAQLQYRRRLIIPVLFFAGILSFWAGSKIWGDAIPGGALFENIGFWILWGAFGICALHVLFTAMPGGSPPGIGKIVMGAGALVVATILIVMMIARPANQPTNMDFQVSVHPAASREFTVLSWNTGSGRASTEDVLTYIRTWNPDMVCLVEAPPRFELSAREQCSETYPVQHFSGGGILYKGVLARGITAQFDSGHFENSRPWLHGTIETEAGRAELYVVHPSPWIAVLGRHSADGRAIAQLAEETRDAEHVIIAGDFNCTDNSSVRRRLTHAGLTDTTRFRKGGREYTFPVFGRYHHLPIPPLVSIDTIFVRGFAASAVQIGNSNASDHLPIHARLRWGS